MTPEPTTKVESVKKTAQDFATAYQKLCEEYGYRITVNPAWITRDDGTYSLVIQSSVGELPKEVEKPTTQA